MAGPDRGGNESGGGGREGRGVRDGQEEGGGGRREQRDREGHLWWKEEERIKLNHKIE